MAEAPGEGEEPRAASAGRVEAPAALPSYVRETRPFSPHQLRELPLFAWPVRHVLSEGQFGGWPYAAPLASALPQGAAGVFCYAVRPPPGVEGCVWAVAVPPFWHLGHFLDCVFLRGPSLAEASFVSPRRSTDRLGSLHLNWPLAGDRARGARRHQACAVHRLLGFTFHFDAARPLGPAYSEGVVVDHVDGHHDNSLLNNLRLMPKPEHDALARGKRKR